jgi:tRNA (guanine-N7-)-methyltransferase
MEASAIINPPDWLNPLNLDDWFPGPAAGTPPAPLHIDIGCGKGRFLQAVAAGDPDGRFLGIDRLLVRLRKIDRRLQREGIANVRLLRLEAAYALRYLIPTAGARRVTIFFPDPWPKRRHHRRRLLGPAFLDDLHRVLLPGGRIDIATDHLDYFSWIQTAFARDPRFEACEPFVTPPEQRTEFELQFLAQGLPIGRASYRTRPAG